VRRRPRKPIGPGLLALLLSAGGCTTPSTNVRPASPIVGAWVVRAPEAPFPFHVFVFHSDGTVEQSNPDAGDPKTSDSNLMGVWVPDGGAVRGKLVEVAADRITHQFVSRTEISFTVRVAGDTFKGAAEARSFDATGRPAGDRVQATLEGERVIP